MSLLGSEIGSEVDIVGDRFGVSVGRFIRTIGPESVAMVSPCNGASEQAESNRTVMSTREKYKDFI